MEKITHQVIRLFIVYDMSMKRHIQVYSPFHIHASGVWERSEVVKLGRDKLG
jgi:hypothetical protein